MGRVRPFLGASEELIYEVGGTNPGKPRGVVNETLWWRQGCRPVSPVNQPGAAQSIAQPSRPAAMTTAHAGIFQLLSATKAAMASTSASSPTSRTPAVNTGS